MSSNDSLGTKMENRRGENMPHFVLLYVAAMSALDQFSLALGYPGATSEEARVGERKIAQKDQGE